MFATRRPGHIEWGNAIDHQRNSFQAARAIAIIMALTGNLGVPGGELETPGSGFREARTRDIAQGDWVLIESPRGRIRQKAKLSEAVDPRVVVADHAWWFPEKKDQDLFGFDESNNNVLTSDQPPFSPEVGSFTIRGVACEVRRVSSE